MFSSKKKPEDVLSDEDALFLQTIEKEMEKHQRQLEIDAQIETAKKTLDTADSATDLFIGVAYFVGQLLIAVPIISAVVNGAKNILSAVTAKSNEGDYTKGVKKITGATGFGLVVATTVVTFLVPPLTLIFAAISASMEVIRDFWVMSAAIISRATGSWKKERDEHENHKNEFYQKLASDPKCLTLINLKREIAALTNSKRPDAKKLMEKEKRYQSLLKQNPTLYAGIITLDAHINQVDNYQRKRDGQLASKTHLFILNASALVGAALLATPLAPFGAAILIGTAIYGILHKFDFPAKWASRISNYFYGPKEPDSVGAIISNAKKRGVKLKLEPDAIEQIEPGLKIKNVHDNSVDLFKKLGAEHVEVDAIIEGETEVIGKEQQLAATIAHLPPLNSKTGENEGEREGETEGMHVKCLAN